MIDGIAHTAFFVTDMKAAMHFYCDLIGMTHAFSLKDDNGDPWIEYCGFGKGQFIELFYGSTYTAKPAYDWNRVGFHHATFETSNLDALARRMYAEGLLSTEHVNTSDDGNRRFLVQDPDGNAVEFVEYTEASPLVQGQVTQGKGIACVAIASEDPERAMKFYRDICGFPVQWTHTGETDHEQTVYLQIKPGQLIALHAHATEHLPPASGRAGFHHFCLEVSDIHAAVSHFEAAGVEIDVQISQGKDLNLQAWIRDPDGIKLELMQISPDAPQAKASLENG